MHIIPKRLKPYAHKLVDSLGSYTGIVLPPYFNLKIKCKYLIRGFDEPDIAFISDEFIRDGQTVIDVGANIGLTARSFAKSTGPSGRVYAIEPERSNFAYLSFNTREMPWVSTHRLAFSANSGSRILRINPVSGTGNSFFGESTSAAQEVNCLTFDEFCCLEKIDTIHCIKIDVEGAELEVLQGMTDTFERNPDLLLLIELCPINLERAGKSGSELLELLRGLGLSVYVLNENSGSFSIGTHLNPLETLGDRSYINLVCSKRDLLEEYKKSH